MSYERQQRDEIDSPTEERDERSLFSQVRLWGGVAGAALLVLFLIQNLQRVDVNFLWFEWHVRLIFALIGSAVLGVFASMLFGFIRRRSQAAERRTKADQEAARERAKKK